MPSQQIQIGYTRYFRDNRHQCNGYFISDFPIFLLEGGLEYGGL
jgi:hypothetical protein